MDFVGSLFKAKGQCVLIDPPEMTAAQIAEAQTFGPPEAILLTNKDHRRGSKALKEAFGQIPLYIHESDRELIDIPVDKTYKDGEELPAGLKVVHLAALKSPGECAFYFNDGTSKIMFIGDAVIGKVPGRLNLLPKEKIPDPKAAKTSLKRLLDFQFDLLILGDGTSIVEKGRGEKALRSFLQQS